MKIRSLPAVVIVAALFVCCTACFGKQPSRSHRTRVNDKYGYIDKRGRWAIWPQFDEAHSFTPDGLAVVRKGKTCYFIDKSGRTSIRPQTTRRIQQLDNFSEGLATIWLADGKCGYIDRTGKIVIKAEFGSAGPFRHGLALVSKPGNTPGHRGFIDKTGRPVVPLSYYIDADGFSEGLAPVCRKEANGNLRSGYLGLNGDVAIGFSYREAQSFSDGLAFVSLPGGLYGYIDKTGKIVVPTKFGDAGDFHKGLAWVDVEKKMGRELVEGHNWGLIDRTGKLVVEPQFYAVGDWSEGMAPVTKGRWILMRTPDGESVPDIKNAKTGFIDQTGRVVVPPRYEAVGPYSEGLASVAVGTGFNIKCGFIDKSGRVVIKPRFDCAEAYRGDDLSQGLYEETFSEGLSCVMMRDGLGYIDKSGRVVIKPQFGEAKPFSQGLASVSYVDHSDEAIESPHDD